MRFDFIKCELFSNDFETWMEFPNRQFGKVLFYLAYRWFRDNGRILWVEWGAMTTERG
jgi:hypothetical protein